MPADLKNLPAKSNDQVLASIVDQILTWDVHVIQPKEAGVKKTITSALVLTLFISSIAWAEGRSYEKPENDGVQKNSQNSEGGRGGRRGRRRGPPQEAIDACNGLSENATCSFESPRRGTMDGTCSMSPRGEELACRPADGGRRRGGRRGDRDQDNAQDDMEKPRRTNTPPEHTQQGPRNGIGPIVLRIPATAD